MVAHLPAGETDPSAELLAAHLPAGETDLFAELLVAHLPADKADPVSNTDLFIHRPV